MVRSSPIALIIPTASTSSLSYPLQFALKPSQIPDMWDDSGGPIQTAGWDGRQRRQPVAAGGSDHLPMICGHGEAPPRPGQGPAGRPLARCSRWPHARGPRRPRSSTSRTGCPVFPSSPMAYLWQTSWLIGVQPSSPTARMCGTQPAIHAIPTSGMRGFYHQRVGTNHPARYSDRPGGRDYPNQRRSGGEEGRW